MIMLSLMMSVLLGSAAEVEGPVALNDCTVLYRLSSNSSKDNLNFFCLDLDGYETQRARIFDGKELTYVPDGDYDFSYGYGADDMYIKVIENRPWFRNSDKGPNIIKPNKGKLEFYSLGISPDRAFFCKENAKMCSDTIDGDYVTKHGLVIPISNGYIALGNEVYSNCFYGKYNSETPHGSLSNKEAPLRESPDKVEYISCNEGD